MEPLSSPWVAADTDRTNGLEQTLQLMSAGERHRFSVAWLDLLARGRQMGRAIVSGADPLPDGHTSRARPRRRGGASYPGALLRRPTMEVPRRFPSGLLHERGVRAFIAIWWRLAPRPSAIVRSRYAVLLPAGCVGDLEQVWRGGLDSVPILIPDGQESALERCFRLIQLRRLPVYLAVFSGSGHGSAGRSRLRCRAGRSRWTCQLALPACAQL